MMMTRQAPLLVALALGLLLGCGSGPAGSVQPTTTSSAKLAATPQTNPGVAASTTTTTREASPAAVAASPGATRAVSPSPADRVAAAPRGQLGPGSPAIHLQPVASGFSQPLYVTHAGDGSGRMFVVEKTGRIIILRNGERQPTPFLDIASLVSRGSEQGLLSVAFHPAYTGNGFFYVNYTDVNGDTVVARYQVSSDNPDVANPNSASTILFVDQPFANHNGGLVMFGPDGYLYVGMGDGGSAGDPRGYAQNKSELLGKMLRIDVDNGSPYAIPADNPFVNEPGTRPEIWAYGLRNPWRFSFDRSTHDLYIADVGQNAWEWVHFQAAGAGGGQNYGWNIVEGSHCFSPRTDCDASRFPRPIAEYSHQFGITVTGGFVYRGSSFPQLVGLYFYGDYGSGRIWAAEQQGPGDWRSAELLDTAVNISSFGEDQDGELYLTGLSDGTLYRVTAP